MQTHCQYCFQHSCWWQTYLHSIKSIKLFNLLANKMKMLSVMIQQLSLHNKRPPRNKELFNKKVLLASTRNIIYQRECLNFHLKSFKNLNSFISIWPAIRQYPLLLGFILWEKMFTAKFRTLKMKQLFKSLF